MKKHLLRVLAVVVVLVFFSWLAYNWDSWTDWPSPAGAWGPILGFWSYQWVQNDRAEKRAKAATEEQNSPDP